MIRSEARTLGLKRFHSGKACPKGHVCERLVSNGTCIECLRPKKHAWNKINRVNYRQEWVKQKFRRMRLEIINRLGGRCACCNEVEPVFLCIDHINGGGTQH